MLQKAILEIMEEPVGREFVKEILTLCGAEEANFTVDPYHNAYQCGRRSVGLILLENIRRTDRGAELEAIMRREARNPPAKEKADSFYDQFNKGDD